MSLAEEISFDKDGYIERFPWAKRFYLSAVILLTALASFGLGKIAGSGERGEIKIEYDPGLNSASVINSVQPLSDKSVVASKNGKKYHYSHCPGAKQISETNKIVFATKEAAEASGYTLASNCSPR